MNTTDIFYILVLIISLLIFFPFIRKIYLSWWRKKKYNQILQTLNFLFADINVFEISKTAREKIKAPSDDLYYGEIDTCALLDLMDIIKPAREDRFYDLGSGSGRASLAVKLKHPTLLVKGIELVPDLHAIAQQKLLTYLDKQALDAKQFGLSFICDNLLNQNFSDADIIFINATAYSLGTWEQILYKLVQLKRGAKIIITSKTLPSPTFVKKYQGMELMSWGLTSTYIYEKMI